MLVRLLAVFAVGSLAVPAHAGEDGAESRVIHWSEAKVKLAAEVREEDFPPRALGLPDERCQIRIHIDAEGVPFKVTPEACNDVYFPYARDVGMRYRFHPVVTMGEAVPAQFLLAINYKGSDSGRGSPVVAAAPPPLVPFVDPHPDLPLVPRSDIELRKAIQVRPDEFPRGLSQTGPRYQLQCVARVYVDERGVPFEVAPERCPEALVASVITTLSRVRVAPIKVQGGRSPASFRVQIDYATGREVPEVEVTTVLPMAGG